MVGEVGDSQIVVNLPVTDVSGCIGSNAKTLGLQHLLFLDMGASGGPPNGTCVVHHGTDELLIQQNTFLMERLLLLFRRGTSLRSLFAAFFLT